MPEETNTNVEVNLPAVPADYHPVNSSQIRAIAYFDKDSGKSMLQPLPTIESVDAPTLEARLCVAGRLEVYFYKKGASGHRWAYHDVPSWIVQEMLEAHSFGSYFAKNIKANPQAYFPGPIPEETPTQESEGQVQP